MAQVLRFVHRRVRGARRRIDPRSYRTIRRGRHRAIVGCPAGFYHRGRCTAATHVTSVLHPRRRRNPDVSDILDRLAEAVQRTLVGDKDGAGWVFHRMSTMERFAFDRLLVRMGDELAYQAGTTESRFRARVARMADLERHRRAGTTPSNPTTRRRRRAALVWRCTGRGAGVQTRCRRVFRSKGAAFRHFEKTGHDVTGPQVNPPRARARRRQNPPRGGPTLIYPEGRLVGTWYGRHRNGGLYKHRFSHARATIYGNPDGSITIKPHRGRLWRNFR